MCQSTLLRRRIAHPWRALGVMVLTVTAQLGVVLLGLAITARTATSSTEVVPVVLVATAVLAIGTVIALVAGRVREVTPHAAPAEQSSP